MTAVDVNPEKVLRDLRDLWAQLGRDQEDSGGVLRACAMTLIAIAADEQGEHDCETVRQTLGVIMHMHPSRAIVLRAIEGAALEARVYAECWKPTGRNQQICSEGIQMTADAANLGEIAQWLLPLIVPDLPVVLWCRGPRFFSTRYFDPLFPLAQKIIVDSSAAPNARGALAVIKELKSRGRRVADLAWTRLTGWREAFSHLSEDSGITPANFPEITVRHGAGESTAVLYFSRWIERSIPAAHITLAEAAGPAGLAAVSFSMNGTLFEVARSEGETLEVRTAGRTSRTLLPASDEAALVGDELAILGADRIFESVLK